MSNNLAAKPSLHDIAGMPFPASLAAMRKFYDPKWGYDTSEDPPRKFKVSIEYSVTTYGDYNSTVEAGDEEQARELAIDEARGEAGGDDFEVMNAIVTEEAEA